MLLKVLLKTLTSPITGTQYSHKGECTVKYSKRSGISVKTPERAKSIMKEVFKTRKHPMEPSSPPPKKKARESKGGGDYNEVSYRRD